MGFLSGLVSQSDAPTVGSSRSPGSALVSASLGQAQGPAPDDAMQQLMAMRSQQSPFASIQVPNYGAAANGTAPYTAAAPATANPTGDLNSWLQQAEQAAGVSGPQWTQGLDIIAQHESGGNPRAVNNWDSNAKAGHPSEGLMQTIGPTFQSYALPGHTDIWNPVDNAIAAIRYIQSRYGNINNVPGVRNVDQGQGYVGY